MTNTPESIHEVAEAVLFGIMRSEAIRPGLDVRFATGPGSWSRVSWPSADLLEAESYAAGHLVGHIRVRTTRRRTEIEVSRTGDMTSADPHDVISLINEAALESRLVEEKH